MEDATQLSRCRQCGAELPADRRDGLCPSCLMAAVAASGSHLTGDELTTLGGRGLKTPGSNDVRLTPGQAFGPYLIGRLLGRGGMGEVYEAEHREHGRRVALKVLNRRLAGPEDRARFLREGQLAASVTHPNTVYIFGSEEIEGTPVISMELVAGGTLKDRVAAAGPLTPAQAVDAVLDLAAGLDAARAGGVLHRDIKPSNCFVESDGRVKIGDFGLSISTIARDVHQRGPQDHEPLRRGFFEGTPQYAAPEQLKGQSLDARADIYAVGATLYYLLTGQPPFDDRDLQSLVARVTEEPAVFPKQRGSRIPPALAAIVLRCLAKERADRPATYAELEDLLRPFSSTAPTAANPGLRLVAGAIDKVLLMLLTAPLTIVPKLEFQQPASVNFAVNYADAAAADASVFAKIVYCGLMVFYYTLLEGLTGASLGKRLCNLQVTARGQHPGVGRAFVRTTIFMLPVWWAYLGLDLWPIGNVDTVNPTGWLVAAMFLTTAVLEALIFTSMRRRNGYAAWHDLATGTRVISRRRDESRTAVDVAIDRTAPAVPPNPIRRLGPFEVTQSLGSTASGELFAGFDPVLRRTVWLHVLPADAPPLAPAWRDLSRPGRQRWLDGRRTGGEAWDAYEAPDGAPLSVVTQARQPWRIVRHWLLDLAREIEAAEGDGTLPALSLDRVWITRSSRAMLLDVQPARTIASAGSAVTASPQQFLAAVAGASLTADPLPLSARTTIDAMARDGVPPDRVAARVEAIARGLDHVTSWRRGVSVGLASAPVILTILAVLALVPIVSRVVQADFLLPMNCLIEINKLDAENSPSTLDLRRSLETYCAATYGRTYADGGFWRDRRARQLTEPLHPIAERVVARYPAVAPADAAAAARATHEMLDEDSARSGAATGLAITMALPSAILLVCAVLALVSSLLVRGGVLMRLLGVAVVDRRGRLVRRPLSVYRALVAWSPALIMWAWFGISMAIGQAFEQTFSPVWLVALAFGVSLAGAAWTIAHPAQSWQDRATGTWVVPR
jgi:hypothetical protein